MITDDDMAGDSASEGERLPKGESVSTNIKGEVGVIESDLTRPDVYTGPSDPSHTHRPVPLQLGERRFVYAAYFAGAIAIAFLISRIFSAAWQKAAALKPMFGEPREDIIIPLSALLGVFVAYYYWKRRNTRELAEQVAEQLGQVTWPNRSEVVNSTVVVILTTTFATLFFALMDRFWGFVTNMVYGA